MDLGLAGRRALVTGGSKGLGRAIAAELAAEGASVAICARHDNEVMAAAESLRRAGGIVHAQVADVTDSAQVEGFVARSAEALGGVDILVNNAGRAHPGNFETLKDEDWQADIDVKLMSMVRCSRAVLPHMRAAGGGRIINIGAVYAKYPDPAFFATTVVRASCQNLSKALAIQLARDNILVNLVNIGFVITPQWQNIHAKRAPQITQEEFFAQLAKEEVPLGRFGRDDEVAGVVAFLAGARASYITGAAIDVAGGMGKYV
ncbi:MAG: SDR family oxidoreductase [Streptosporangiaceae bacterium]|nr:SDR family oxidoreductase [Streptosporangiaceae bacterium]